MAKKSRQRQLQKLAEQRAEERRRQRRNRIFIWVVAGAIAVAGIGVGAVALLGGDDEPAQPSASQNEQDPENGGDEGDTMAGNVACGGSVPKGADEQKPSYDQPPPPGLQEGADYRAVMTTSCGKITLDLYEDKTPITVNNFVFLSREGFYDGTVFHRVIADFMNQGGDPEGTGMGGPGYQFEDEVSDDLTFDKPGYLAMANAGPGTNGSQFFITTVPTPHLNGLHTIFGEVVEGMDVVQQINGLPTDPSDRPVDTVYVESIEIQER